MVMEKKIKYLIPGIFAILIIYFLGINNLSSYQKEFTKPTSICSQKECEINLCQPEYVLSPKSMNLYCQLPEKTCKCQVYNYGAFYQGLGNNKDFYNPSANIYKSYKDLTKFIGGDVEKNPPKLTVNFIQGKMQSYSNQQINIWPLDTYGQYHESIHFILRYYTQPQDGFYPYLEEGLAHYGAYCYNNPNTQRCNYNLGDYQDKDICTPNKDKCIGQVRDTSLVLELRKDYNCDWEHCWREFLQWATTEMKGQPLNLRDAINELNLITGKDIRDLLSKYGIKELDYTVQLFVISYEDEVKEEEIVNDKGEFTTL